MYLRKKRVFVLGVITFILLFTLIYSASAAKNCGGAVTCACGDTLTSSYNMSTDNLNCTIPYNGLTIGANDLIFDCTGHKVLGDEAKKGLNSVGFSITNYKNITIKNCNIVNFSTGVYMESSGTDGTASLIYNNTFRSNSKGIDTLSSENINISNNTFTANTEYALYLGDPNSFFISLNYFLVNGYNGLPGIKVADSRGATTNNYFTYNTLLYTNVSFDTAAYSNYVYNNIFGLSKITSSTSNYFNTTLTTVTNAAGGIKQGGNWWTDYSGNDTNDDSIGDTSNYTAYGSDKDYLPLVTVYAFYKPSSSMAANLTINSTFNFTNPMTNNSKHSTRQNITIYNSSASKRYIIFDAYFNKTVNLNKLQITENETALAINVTGTSGYAANKTLFFQNNNAGNGIKVYANAMSLSQMTSEMTIYSFTYQNVTNANRLGGMLVSFDNDQYKVDNVTNTKGVGITFNTEATLTTTDDSDTQVRRTSQNVTVYANYSDTGGRNITGATCNLTYVLPSGSSYTSALMIFNATSKLYEFGNVSYNELGNYTYNVTCNKTLFDTKAVTGSVNISNIGCPYYINSNFNLNEDINATTDCLVVNASNIAIDGGNHLLNSTAGTGLFAQNKYNISISNIRLAGFTVGLNLSNALNQTLTNVTVIDPINYGFYFSDINSSSFIGINVTSTTSAKGITLNNGFNNAISSSYATTSSGDAVLISGSSANSNFTSCILSSISAKVINSTSTGNNTFIASVFNRSLVNTSTGAVFVKWYLTAHIQDSLGLPVWQAQVNITEKTSLNRTTLITDNSGNVQVTATDFYSVSNVKTYETPHNINASFPEYTTNSTTVNLTATNSTTATLTLPITAVVINDCNTYATSTNLSGGTTYSNSPVCIIVSGNDVDLNGNGSTIISNASTAFVGVIASGVQNVTIHNITLINFTMWSIMGGDIQNFSVYNATIRTGQSSSYNPTGIYLYNSTGANLSSIYSYSTTVSSTNIYLFKSSNNTLRSNELSNTGNTSEGIYIDNSSSYNLITLNLINVSGTSSNSINIYNNSNYNNITYNDIFANGTSGRGFNLYQSSYALINNNNVTGYYGLITTTSPFVNISSNKFVSADDNVVLVGTNYNQFYNNTLNATSEALFFSGGVYNNITQNNITAQATGIWLQANAIGNNFSNNIINVTGAGSYGVGFMGLSFCENNTFVRDTINSVEDYDIYTNNYRDNYFIDCVTNESNLEATDIGTIQIQHYVNLSVKGAGDAAISGANASLYNLNNVLVFAELTAGSGKTSQHAITEFYENGSGKQNATPHNITGTLRPTYHDNSTTLNLSFTGSTEATLYLGLNNNGSVAGNFIPTAIYGNTTSFNLSLNYSDAEGDVGTLRINWSVNGVYLYNETVTGIASGGNTSRLFQDIYYDFSKGDVITAGVIADDAYMNSSVYNFNITVSNLAPYLSELLFNSTSYGSSGLPLVNLTYQDQDSDNGEILIKWYINDILINPTHLYSSQTIGTTINDTYTGLTDFKKGDRINVTVNTSDGSASVLNFTNITIGNTVPIISTALSNVSLNTSQNWYYDFNATDIDVTDGVDVLNWSSNTSWLEIASATGIVNYTANESNDGAYYVMITVNDTTNLSDVDTEIFLLTINDTLAPRATINYPTATNYTSNTSINLNFTVNESNTGSCWFGLNGTGVNTSISGCVNTTFNTTSGTHTLTLYVNDTTGNLNTTTVTFTVNQPPTISAVTLSPTTAHTNSTLNATVTLSDDLVTNITTYYNWSVEGALVVQTNSSALSTSSSSTLAGTYFNKTQNVSVIVWATDSISNTSATESSKIIQNSAPYQNTTLPTTSVQSGSSTSINLSNYFVDADNDDVNYSVLNSSIATLIASNTTKLLTITGTSAGTTSVNLNATDGTNTTASSNFTITVTNADSSSSSSGGGGGSSSITPACRSDADCPSATAKECSGDKVMESTISYACTNPGRSSAACTQKSSGTTVKDTCMYGCSAGACLSKKVEQVITAPSSSCPPGTILNNGACTPLELSDTVSIDELEKIFGNRYHPSAYHKMYHIVPSAPSLRVTGATVYDVTQKTYEEITASKSSQLWYDIDETGINILWVLNEKGEVCSEVSINSNNRTWKFWKDQTLFSELYCFQLKDQPSLVTQHYDIDPQLRQKIENGEAKIENTFQ